MEDYPKGYQLPLGKARKILSKKYTEKSIDRIIARMLNGASINDAEYAEKQLLESLKN